MSGAYYNEIEPYAVQWLRNLIKAGHIAPGDVDDRNILDVTPDDLRGYTQCHFFAGIGVWSLALRRAGWADDRPVWSGSAPCQPFSAAGAGAGFADERHLWPAFHHLIAERRPSKVLGEQVASSHVNPWIDLVQSDLEALGYGFAGVPFPSAGIGAPHIRDRLYWVADSQLQQRSGGQRAVSAVDETRGRQQGAAAAARLRDDFGLDHPDQHRFAAPSVGRIYHTEYHVEPCGDIERVEIAHASGQRAPREERRGATGRPEQAGHAGAPGGAGGLGNSPCADGQRDAGSVLGAQAQVDSQGRADGRGAVGPEHASASVAARPGPVNGFWSDADWLLCRDGKWRPVEPGTFPLAHGAAGGVGRVRADQERIAANVPRKDQGSRVGRLRAYGNAVNAEAARIFIQAVMECEP